MTALSSARFSIFLNKISQFVRFPELNLNLRVVDAFPQIFQPVYAKYANISVYLTYL